jgi:hypothetical protein
MMRRSQSHWGRWPQPMLRRLERAAGAINPFLIMIAIGLVILDLSCLLALRLARMPLPRASVIEIAIPPVAMVPGREGRQTDDAPPPAS